MILNIKAICYCSNQQKQTQKDQVQPSFGLVIAVIPPRIRIDHDIRDLISGSFANHTSNCEQNTY
jgi:hypothetical protein